MCDEKTEGDIAAYVKRGGQLNRRDFARLGTAATFAAIFPLSACVGAQVAEADIAESEVDVPMAKGVSDSYFVRPSSGKHPAVLIWPDIKGLRPAFKAMGKRMAMSGYSVLVVNPFYRDAKHPVFGPDASFGDPETRAFLFGMASKLTQDASMADAADYFAFLDAQTSVDTARKAGTAGYCMGGPLIMRTAAALPDRIGAAASFHGSRLVTDAPDSPHLLIPKTPAAVLHAIAENDDEKAPEAKTILREAYDAADVSAEIEVYADTLHGWCPPDSQVHNQAQADKAWARMLALFETALV